MNRSTGSVMIETLVALPVVLSVGFLVVQWALIYEARAVVDHATLMAARAGAIENAKLNPMRNAFARALVGLNTPKKTAVDFEQQLITKALPAARKHARFRVLSPTHEAFADHGERNNRGKAILPFRDLNHLPTTPGARSGLSVQEAAWLQLEVTYGYPLIVPYANTLILRALEATTRLRRIFDLRERRMLDDGRLPLSTTVTVRMQSQPIKERHFIRRHDDK